MPVVIFIIIILSLSGCEIDLFDKYPPAGSTALELMKNYSAKKNAMNIDSIPKIDDFKNNSLEQALTMQPNVQNNSNTSNYPLNELTKPAKPRQSFALKPVEKVYPHYSPEADNPETTYYYLVPQKSKVSENGFAGPFFK